MQDALIKLNSSIPTLSGLKVQMDNLIDTPFELLKTQINTTRLEIAASFNSSVLPIPTLSALSASNANDLSNELCSGLDTSLIDGTASALNKLANTAIGLMFLVLILVWAGLCVWEWRRWRAMTRIIALVEDEWVRHGGKDAWRVVSVVEHPMLERCGSRIVDRLAEDDRARTNVRWYREYRASTQR